MTYAPIAERLYCVGEITVQYNADTTTRRERITTSLDAFYVFKQYWSEQINRLEEFYIMLLGPSNDVLGIYRVTVGGTSLALVDPKIVFQVALGCHASNILLAHNHPSGNLQPSQADLDLTRRFQYIGKMMECPVLDHLILSPNPYEFVSLADEKYI